MRRILTALMIGMSLMLGTLSGNVCAQSVKELSRHDLQSWKMRYVIIEDDERNMIINVFDGVVHIFFLGRNATKTITITGDFTHTSLYLLQKYINLFPLPKANSGFYFFERRIY